MKMDAVFSECEQFADQPLYITLCRGERLTPEKCDKWRVSRGLEPRFSGLPRHVLTQPVRSASIDKPVLQVGPGTEFKSMIDSLHIPKPEGCDCEKLRAEMDLLGVVGCRRERERLLGDIKANSGKVSWLEKLKAIVPAVTTGLAFSLNPLDPIGSLFDEAVAIAERKESERKKKVARSARPAGAGARGSTRRRGKGPWAMAPGTPRFVSVSEYMQDVKRLASMLPADTSCIVGIARSGLCAATMVSMLLHRPLHILRQSKGDLIDGGNGWRLTGNTTAKGPAVLIDDTTMTGNSFKHVTAIARAQFPNLLTAAVYCNPNAWVKPDLWAVELPWPHILEWNMFNSVLSPSMALDFDGILCHDCPPGSDDDGPRYAKFLAETKPLYLCRKMAVPLIVTARLEKYRPQTMEWLARHGITVHKLIMGPWASIAERRRSDVAAYKAQHYREFLRNRRGLRPFLFVESEEWQAKRIAEMSGGITCCPAAGRCFP